ncbi:Bicarbonate transport system permease protein CmpB [Paraliobacillus sp. PM-2]|uniref:ABC transporter permease n=1 Tax=Paraliobacillus sp. PM-2 TaxID=1462524 RepID=UPI00061CA2C8|nr:ABC transporter permease [Paraliobacillus sp. PM-2]CQR45965.1 Bicarbonate transport system permease protein CmpB [Paraliobacillus sp. PM-2]
MKYLRIIGNNQLVIGFLMTLLAWQLVYSLIDTHTIPSPQESIIYLYTMKGPIALHLLASMARVWTAIAISLVIGLPIGILAGVNRVFDQLFSPFLYYIYPIPKVAFLPVLMLLYGLGNQSKILLIIFIIVFQIILSVRDGVRQIPPSYFTVMHSFAASKVAMYRYLIIPAILPQLFSGLRISIGISLATLFFAENYATTYGIGYFILSAWTKMDYIEMFSGILALSFLGILMFKLIDMLEINVTPWNKKPF